MKKVINFIIPVFNEGSNVFLIYNAINDVLKNNRDYEHNFIFIDDGSQDDSLKNIIELATQNSSVKYLSFSRNFGKDCALMAGINYCSGDAAIMIDADLQHPPALILQMLDYWQQGYEIVYCKRDGANDHTSFFGKLFSALFYKLMIFFSNIDIETGAADYRLVSKKVMSTLNRWNEHEPFYRGLTKWVGYSQKSILYVPEKRVQGTTKYSKKALVRLALQGITSFSVQPLNVSIYIGCICALISILYLPYVAISVWYGYAVSGWASVIMTIVFFGGMQLIILGIIGLYLGKLFMQSKYRPEYIVNQTNF